MKKINEEKFRKELRRRLELIREQQLGQGALDILARSREESDRATADSTFDIPEGMTSTELAEKKLFSFPSETAKQEQIANLEKEIESMKKGPVTLSQSEATNFAVAIHDATIGSTGIERVTRMVGVGLGTDEAAIGKVMGPGIDLQTGARIAGGIPTCVDVSYVSEQFEKLYAGVWSFTPTLNAVLSSELDDEDFRIHVGIPLATKKDTAFIKIGDSVLGESEFYDLLQLGSDLQKLEGEFRDGKVAGSGLVTSLAVVTGNYKETFSPGEGTNPPGASADPAANAFVDGAALSSATAALFLGKIKDIPVIDPATGAPMPKAESAKLRAIQRIQADWDVFKSGYKGSASARHAAKAQIERRYLAACMEAYEAAVPQGSFSTPAGRARAQARVSERTARIARETFDEAWEQTSRGWFRSKAVSADDVARIAASKSTHKAAAKRAAGEAAEGLVKGSLARVGFGGAARGIGKLGARAIPYVGLVLLANDLVQWFTNADIDPTSDMIMNSEFHKRVKTLYTGFEQRQRATLAELQSVPVITNEMIEKLEREEAAQAEADARDEAERRMEEARIAEQEANPMGVGNFEYMVDKTTGCWMTRRQGTVDDFTSLKGNNNAMAELDRRYPGARTGAQIAMCASGGAAASTTPGAGAGAGGVVLQGQDAARRTQQELPQVTPRRRGRMTWKDVRIDLRSDATGGTIPLSRVNKDAANFLAFDLIKGLPETRGLGTLSGTAINPERVISLKMYRDGNKVRIEKVKLFGKTGRAELNRFVSGGDNIVFNSLNSNLTKDQKQFFEKRNGIEVDLVITIPRGVYTRDVPPPARQVDVAEQEAISESKIRKAVRREILKQLLS